MFTQISYFKCIKQNIDLLIKRSFANNLLSSVLHILKVLTSRYYLPTVFLDCLLILFFLLFKQKQNLKTHLKQQIIAVKNLWLVTYGTLKKEIQEKKHFRGNEVSTAPHIWLIDVRSTKEFITPWIDLSSTITRSIFT